MAKRIRGVGKEMRAEIGISDDFVVTVTDEAIRIDERSMIAHTVVKIDLTTRTVGVASWWGKRTLSKEETDEMYGEEE